MMTLTRNRREANDFRWLLSEAGSLSLYLGLAFVALGRIILSRGVIGLSHDWSVPPYPAQILQSLDLIRWVWTDAQFGGEVYFVGYWGYVPMIAMASLGLDGEFVSKAYVVTLLAASGYSLNKLVSSIGVARAPSLMAGALYMFFPMPFNRLAAGHIFHLFGYAFMPLAVMFFLKAFESRDSRQAARNIIIAGLATGLAATQLQFLPLIGLVFMAYGVYALATRSASLHRILITIFAPLMIAVSLYLPWFLPKLANPAQTLVIGGATFASEKWLFDQLNTTSLTRALTLDFGLLGYFGRVNESVSWAALSQLIGIACISLPVYSNRVRIRKHAIVWTVLSLVFLFLTLGERTLLSLAIWRFIYSYLRPLLAFVGEMENLMYVPTLGFAFLFSILLDGFLRVSRSSGNDSGKGRRAEAAGLILISILLAAYASPSVLSYPSVLQTYSLDPAYQAVYAKLADGGELTRLLFVPPVGEYGATMPGLKLGGIDIMIAFPPKPSFPQFFGGYTGSAWSPYHSGLVAYTTFATASMYHERTDRLGYLLGLFGVREVVVRNDTDNLGLKITLGQDYLRGQSIILRQSDMERLETSGPLTVLRNKDSLPYVYAASPGDAWIVAGNLASLVSATYAHPDAVKDLPRLVIYPAELTGERLAYAASRVNTALIDSYQLNDLVFARLPAPFRIYMGQVVERGGWTPSSGWTRPYWPKEWAVQAEVMTPLFAQTPGTVSIPFTAPKSDRYSLFAKIFFSPSASAIHFEVDGRELIKVKTKSAGEFYRWIDLGDVALDEGSHSIAMTGTGLKEAASLMWIAPSDMVDEAIRSVEAELGGKRVMMLFEMEKATNMTKWVVRNVGLQASSGQAITSTHAENSAEYQAFLPTGEYSASFRLRSNKDGRLLVTLESMDSRSGKAYSLNVKASESFGWHRVDLGDVEKGRYRIHVSSTVAESQGDLFVIMNSRQAARGEDPRMQVRRVDPTRYEVSIRSDGPAFIVHAETYSPFWEARDADGQPLDSIVVNAFAQAYYWKGGDGKIVIRYVRQDLFSLGWNMSLASYGILFTGLALTYRRRR